MIKAVYELLADINAVEDENERIRVLAEKTTPRLREFIYYALSPTIKWDLPEGAPPFIPNNEINSYGFFWPEIRRLPLFFVGGKLQHDRRRREQLFTQLLETIHPKDAELLVSAKDRTWKYENLIISVINQALNNLIEEGQD